MSKLPLLFLQKPSCTTCRNARSYLESRKIPFESRDLDKQRLSTAELDALIGDRDYIPFLNPRNDLYRELNMREKPPSRSKAIKLMAENPNLIRRPVVITSGAIPSAKSPKSTRILTGFDPDEYEKL